MDESIFILGIVLVLTFMILGLVERKVEWSVFPAMGMIIGIYLTIALLSDGSLTTNGGTVVVAVASSTTTSVWRMIELIPELFSVSAGLITAYKVGVSFQ